ncbi:SecY-interacting protein [Alkalimarinus coralli]|uniref:SecY-interacting protein n=1 Tax=Alkalimarinus coralli TaxID=2935863 RepID=UPI00202ACD13|nr:SecY-interacting protein [Alkalimarinus coralli]
MSTTPSPRSNPAPSIKAIESLLDRFIALSLKIDLSLPKVEWDKNWTSECIVDPTPDNHGLVQWKPAVRGESRIFSALEGALETTFHPDINRYYGHYWSDGIVVSHETGEMSLIQIWNSQDEEMLKQNLLGHAFAKKKNRLPLTLFIGCTQDDQIIAIDNASGNIVLEKPGFAAHQTIATDLEAFLGSVTPTLKAYNG